jgi:hypothetical protein
MGITVVTPPTEKRLLSGTDVTALTGYTSETLDTLVSVASMMIEARIGRPIFYGQYRETLPGLGLDVLQLGVIPVSTTQTITVEDLDQEAEITDFQLDEPNYGWLYRRTGWPSSNPHLSFLTEAPVTSNAAQRTLQVTYWAGWLFNPSSPSLTTVPADLKFAAALSVKALAEAGTRDLAITHWRSGDVDITYRQENQSNSFANGPGVSSSGAGSGLLPPEALFIIDQYANAF